MLYLLRSLLEVETKPTLAVISFEIDVCCGSVRAGALGTLLET